MASHSDPRYLHSFGHLGVVLVSQPLISDNFNSWCRAMIIDLNGKKKPSFVDGPLQKLEDQSSQYCSWMRNNNIVYSCLLNSVSKENTVSVIYAANVVEILKEL